MSLHLELFDDPDQALTAVGPRCFEGGEYQHYKGGVYTTLHLAVEEATGREVVVYRGEDGRVWTRPTDSFFAAASVFGKFVPRFKFRNS